MTPGHCNRPCSITYGVYFIDASFSKISKLAVRALLLCPDASMRQTLQENPTSVNNTLKMTVI